MMDTVSASYKQIKLIAMLKNAFEEAKLQLAQKMESSDKKSAKQSGYFERYLTRIRDNLRLEIGNISLRLEDPVLNTCLGLQLNQISLRTVKSF